MLSLAEFLLARIADTEQRCGAWHEVNCDGGTDWEDRCSCGLPLRIRAGCTATREVVSVLTRCADVEFTANPTVSGLAVDALRALGAAHIDHRDYDHDWNTDGTGLLGGER